MSHTNGSFPGGIPRRVPTGYYISIGPSGAKYRPTPMQVLNSTSDLPSLFDNLAASITNNLRLNDESGTVVHGTSEVVVYMIRWLYIILPAMSTLGGTSFLLLSAVHTRRLGAPLWKSNAAAMLKCGAALEGFAMGRDRASEIEKAAEETQFGLGTPGREYCNCLAYSIPRLIFLDGLDEKRSSSRALDQDTSYSSVNSGRNMA